MARSDKAERENFRRELSGRHWTVRQIAEAMGRKYRVRPRTAWRWALGWNQTRTAMKYNEVTPPESFIHPSRISKWEGWPAPGSLKPNPLNLVELAMAFGHGCTASDLVDEVDEGHYTTPEQILIGRPQAQESQSAVAVVGFAKLMPTLSARPAARMATGLPSREEVDMAADESAAFQRWSAATNVNEDVLEQMHDDVADLARTYLTDPPAAIFARAVNLRDTTIQLLAGGRQKPLHTIELYRVAGSACALLAHAAADLNQTQAAITQARTALHCADMIDFKPLRVYTRWVQSNVAYWDGRYSEAARLVESAFDDATSGTSMLRMRSQQARIAAARGDDAGMARALIAADAASREESIDEPGVFGFASGKAAYYTSEAYRETGQTTEAVRWAQLAVDEFAAERRPSTQLVAAAQMDLARAYLAADDVDAVGEHLAPMLSGVQSEHRTVPVLSRARTLSTLLGEHDAPAAATLRDELLAFCAAPAVAPPLTIAEPPALGK
jgi:hypothetical protein